MTTTDEIARTTALGPDWTAIAGGLQAEFPADEVGTVPIGGGGTARYVNARSVHDRLDQVVGPGNWSTFYRIVDAPRCAVECVLTIHGVAKADVGYPNDPSDVDNAQREPLKAAYSDSLKRAAVSWGIGRYLYPSPAERGTGKGSPDLARTGRVASEKQINFLKSLAEKAGVPLPNDGDLTDLPGAIASRWIEDLRSKGAHADLAGWGQPPAGSYQADGGYVPAKTQGVARQDADPFQEMTPNHAAQPAQGQAGAQTATVAETDEESTEAQRATITKLAKVTGEKDNGATLSRRQAGMRITELSNLFNAKKRGQV